MLVRPPGHFRIPRVPALDTSYATGFDATENPISEGGKWLNGLTNGLDWTDVQTANGRAAATSIELSPPPYNDSICCLNPAKFAITANQYAQGTCYVAPGYTQGHESLLLLRFKISAHVARGYECYRSIEGGVTIVRWNGAINDFSPLANDPAIAPVIGQVMRFEATGSTLRVLIDGVQYLSITDGTWTDGLPGHGDNPWGASADFYSYGWSDYQAGGL